MKFDVRVIYTCLGLTATSVAVVFIASSPSEAVAQPAPVRSKQTSKPAPKPGAAAAGAASNAGPPIATPGSAAAPAPASVAPKIKESKGTSADARAKKTISLNVMPAGFIPRFASGVMLGIHVGSTSIIELFAETGSCTCTFDGLKTDRLRTGVRWLWFPGNSFFLAAGANYDKMDGAEDDTLGLDFLQKTREWKGTYSQAEASFGIGNRWMWDFGLNIGAEWVGLSQPLVKISESYSSKGYADSQKKDADDNNDRLRRNSQTGSLHFAKGTIGFAF